MDAIVIGGGLAGCAMVWQCWARGLSVLMIDDPKPDAASRVSAGLVTPVTGSRFAKSWRWEEFFPAADAMYRRAEQVTGRSFWSVAPAWRAFTSSAEVDLCQERWLETTAGPPSTRTSHESEAIELSPLDSDLLPASLQSFGGISMSPAARLDVPMYLEATRDLLAKERRLLSMDLDLDQGLQPATDGVVLPGVGVAARWMVLCQGYRSLANHWFDTLPLHPARGDILTIYCPTLKLDHVLHYDSWIVPLGDHHFLTGATYDRHALQTTETDAAASRYRRELSQRWERTTGHKIDGHESRIIRHGVAVRPASYDRHPLLGAHPRFPRILCLNGLGSKGSLMAPRLASHLLQAMLDKEGIEASLYWMRRRR